MRIFKYAMKNIARNSFLSFSTVLVLSLMTFFIYVLFFVEYVASAIIGNISDRLSLSLNLKPGFSDTSREIVELTNGLRAVDPSVETKYVSNAEAYEILKKRDPELARVIESDKDNPLPSSLSVKNVPIAKYAELDAVVSKHKDAVQYDAGTGKKTIVDYRAQYEKIKGLTDVLMSIRYGIIFVVGLFLFAVSAIVYNAIGNSVFFYREEIRIIGLVGGGARFVYGPFAVQGFAYAMVAAVLSLATFASVIKSVNFALLADFPIFVDKFFVERQQAFLSVVCALAFVALVSGFLSSYRFARRAG